MNRRTDYLPFSLLLFSVLGLIPSVLAYQHGVSLLIPAQVNYDLWPTIWQGTFWDHDDIPSRIARTWPYLVRAHYGAYFALSILAATLTGGGWVALTRRQPASLLHAVLGWSAGAAAGLALPWLVSLPPLWGVLAMPVLAFVGGYLATMFTAPPLPEMEPRIVRGTRIVAFKADTHKAVATAIREERVCLAGYVLPVKAEVRSILLLGAPGTGKTVAIEALMHTILARGNRMIVADPDGAAMSKGWKDGDTILNPLDGRSVRWEILAEIRASSDFKHLAESILPFTGDARIDEWRTHSQEIFAACLQTWAECELGSSDDFLRTMARGGVAKMRLLCQGTAAADYFGEGGERMLSSILSTLRPSLNQLEMLVGPQGEPFSVRQWVREGTGTLWVPYHADQIAALRGPISCWMRLAVFELLSMKSSRTRRMWFFLDELDALGRIQGLKDAMVRARKKGGCIVAGIQSIAQVRAVYGDAEAQTIVEMFGTQLVLKCGASEGGGTARFASDLIGQREVERIETSTSYNQGQNGPSTTTSYRRSLEQAVLPSEIMQLPDLSGYLRVSGQEVWMKVSFEPIELEEHTSPSEPVKVEGHTGISEQVEDQTGSHDTQCPHAASGVGPIVNEQGYPRMSFPFRPERVFDLMAELYGAEHPQRPPAPRLEGKDEEINEQWETYRTGWIDRVWPDFRQWWTNAPEEERYHKAMAALKPAGLELAGFDAIPEDVWEQVKELRPAEEERPFLN